MNPEELATYLSEKGFSVKQVPFVNTLGKLGKDGVNTFDLTSNFCDKFIGSKFWTCPACAKMYESQSMLNNHIKVEHFNINVPNPSNNNMRITKEQDATSYIIIKTENEIDPKKKKTRRPETKPRKPYEKKSLDFIPHVEINGPFKCDACNEIFSDCCNFSTHMNNVHFKKRRMTLRCQICERKYTGKVINDNNVYPYESGASISQLSCDICGKTFSLQVHLDHHIKKYHSKVKPYECSLCVKSFSQITGLSQHIKTHSGVKPFSCNVCMKSFRQKAGLDQHMRIHSKIKPYNCLICNRAFTQSAHLSQHMRVHTKIEPFECPKCNRRFKQSSHLNFHMRSHESQNEWKCTICLTLYILKRNVSLI